MSLYDRSRARRSLFDTVAYRIASQLATAIGYVVLVRTMSKQDFGIFNLLYSFIPLVGTAALSGTRAGRCGATNPNICARGASARRHGWFGASRACVS